MKSSGQCMCLPKRQERYHEIYHEMKIDGKNGQKVVCDRLGLGMFVFFFVLIAELFSDLRSFMFPGTKSKPFKTLNPSCSHIR